MYFSLLQKCDHTNTIQQSTFWWLIGQDMQYNTKALCIVHIPKVCASLCIANVFGQGYRCVESWSLIIFIPFTNGFKINIQNGSHTTLNFLRMEHSNLLHNSFWLKSLAGCELVRILKWHTHIHTSITLVMLKYCLHGMQYLFIDMLVYMLKFFTIGTISHSQILVALGFIMYILVNRVSITFAQ